MLQMQVCHFGGILWNSKGSVEIQEHRQLSKNDLWYQPKRKVTLPLETIHRVKFCYVTDTNLRQEIFTRLWTTAAEQAVALSLLGCWWRLPKQNAAVAVVVV